MEQQWRVYAPEGRNTSWDSKMHLRNMVQISSLIGRGEVVLEPASLRDMGDDVYTMNVQDEKVTVVAREYGQRDREEGVFEEVREGIFIKSSEKNFRQAEGKIVRLLS